MQDQLASIQAMPAPIRRSQSVIAGTPPKRHSTLNREPEILVECRHPAKHTQGQLHGMWSLIAELRKPNALITPSLYTSAACPLQCLYHPAIRYAPACVLNPQPYTLNPFPTEPLALSPRIVARGLLGKHRVHHAVCTTVLLMFPDLRC